MNLGIAHHTCNQCGAMIVPPLSVNTGGEKLFKKKLEFLPDDTSLTDEQVLPLELYGDIQSGKYDADPKLLLLKGKTYPKAVTARRTQYKARRDTDVIEKRAKAVKELDKIKPYTKLVTSTETTDEIIIEEQRHEAIIEGDQKNVASKCPVCEFVLMSWSE